MRTHKIIYLLALLFISTFAVAQPFKNFISVSGNKLMDGDKEFRFISYNIPNLNYVEDELAFTTISPFRFPTEFEIRDALLSIKQMGGRVTRVYTIPVKRSDQADDVPSFVLGPGKFNEDAFKVNDMMLAIANEVGIRLIFPIVNNWKWMGGRPQYAEFRGKQPNDFWTDPQLIDDVKKTIEYTLNRTNTITGVKYKDDKAILCWETGNELDSPVSWTIIISKYIKEIDKNHLVMDGYAKKIRPEILDEPSVDIVNTHHYEIYPDETRKDIEQNLKILEGRKPYMIGEFGFQSTTGLEQTMDLIISDHNICGGMVWSLRSHREEGGFYYHSEPMGLGIYKAYHWPGFDEGNIYDEKNFVNTIRRKAFEISGIDEPAMEKPASPRLLPISAVYDINWQGSTGASSYDIERSEKQNEPWKTIAPDISDVTTQYHPLFNDQTATLGKSYYYRVIARNIGGDSDPSNIVGPVPVTSKAVVDEMSNFGVMFYGKDISLKTGDDRKFKEDVTRIEGNSGSEIIYYNPGTLLMFKIFSFENKTTGGLSVLGSSDGTNYTALNARMESFYESRNDYDAWNPILYTISGTDTNLKYLKIQFKNNVQIGRVEVIYK